MSLPWFFARDVPAVGERLELEVREAKHASAARRLGGGSALTVFDGRGCLAQAVIEQPATAPRQPLVVRITQRARHEPLPQRIDLLTALPKGDRQATMLNMIAQLGVASITPLITARSIVKPTASFHERAQRIMIEACKQSRCPWLPTVHEALRLDEQMIAALALRSHGHDAQHAAPMCYLVADQSGAPLIDEASALLGRDIDEDDAAAPQRIGIIIGPEGGLSAEELALLDGQQCPRVSLGPTVLRIETAAVAACAVLSMMMVMSMATRATTSISTTSAAAPSRA